MPKRRSSPRAYNDTAAHQRAIFARRTSNAKPSAPLPHSKLSCGVRGMTAHLPKSVTLLASRSLQRPRRAALAFLAGIATLGAIGCKSASK